MASLLLFALDAGVSAYDGVSHMLIPEPLTNVEVNYIVLSASAVRSGLVVDGLERLSPTKGSLGYWQAIRESKYPLLFMVLLEDTAALGGWRVRRRSAGRTCSRRHRFDPDRCRAQPDRRTLSLEFEDALRTPDIERSVLSLEQRIRSRHLEIVALFVKPQTHRTFDEAAARDEATARRSA